MDYLTEEDLFPGSLIKIYINKRFEAYGILIERAGKMMTYMEDLDDIIYGKVRWLIEWASDDCIEDAKERMMTQRILAGKRTHRTIHYIAGRMVWETYAKENGYLRHKNYGQSTLLNIDDETCIF